MEKFDLLVRELCKLSTETQWVEFKHNNYTPEMIGQDISALANGAALYDKTHAYMLWGIDDVTHNIVGTSYDLLKLKKGNQELESWLRELTSKNCEFEYQTVIMDNLNVGILIIGRSENYPVRFQNIEYIRIGSYTKKLNDYPTVQSQLWAKIQSNQFEDRYAAENLSRTDALADIDYSSYFDMIGVPQPTDAIGVAHYLLEEGILAKQDNGLYAITNLGAILFSKRLSEYSTVSRKAIRVVQYEGKSRENMLKETVGVKGYAIGFEGLLGFIEALLPTHEIIQGATRKKVTAYPLIALRELIANALIHQDFAITGAGPVVEIFSNRIEITNPGIPLVDRMRIIDNPPRSRNEKLASFMRRLRMCEELGTGWDKVVINCELYRLPAPSISLYEDSVRVTIYNRIPFASISAEERLWACYLHACIRQVQGERLTNTSLRERFGLSVSSSANISRVIRDAVAKELIKPLDPSTAPRYMSYVPIWA